MSTMELLVTYMLLDDSYQGLWAVQYPGPCSLNLVLTMTIDHCFKFGIHPRSLLVGCVLRWFVSL